MELMCLTITLSHLRHDFLNPNVINIQHLNFYNNVYWKFYKCNFLPWHIVNQFIMVCMEGMECLKQSSCLQRVYHLIEDMYISKSNRVEKNRVRDQIQ